MSSEKVGTVVFQLDYYPSSQFAGLHLALKSGMYAAQGLDVVLVPPTPSGGEEPELVVQKQREFDSESGSSYSNFPAGIFKSIPKVCIGSAEQSVILGAVARNVPVKGFATIFQESPLCLAGLPGADLSSASDLIGKGIGMHIDSYELTSCLLSHATDKFKDISIRVDERATKLEALHAKEVDAIQVYSCYETVELEMKLGTPPKFLNLASLAPESTPPFSLGYGQALFGAAWTLRSPEARDVIRKFLEATQEGWIAASKDPQAAVDAILEARAAAGYAAIPEFQVVNTADFIRRSLTKCLDLVMPGGPAAAAAAGGGVLLRADPARWQQSAEQLGRLGYLPAYVDNTQSFAAGVWPAEAAGAAAATAAAGGACVIPDGRQIAAAIRREGAARAAAYARRNGRRPRLAVVRVGPPRPEAKQRMELFSQEDCSWFSKHLAVAAAGIDYIDATLPIDATYTDVLLKIRSLNRRADVDAILLERPLPGTLNADALGAHIHPSKNVDADGHAAPLPGARGAAPVQALAGAFTDLAAVPDAGLPAAAAAAGAAAAAAAAAGAPPAPWLAGDGGAELPIFAAAALRMLDRAGAAGRLPGARAVVVGRSRRLGLPLALALVRRDATVTVCHAATPPAELRAACAAADVLLVAAGAPGLVTRDMVRPGAAVINLGTTFDRAAGRLLPDVDPAAAEVASLYTPTPHGMGPLMTATLIDAALACAEARALADRVRRRHKAAADPAAGAPPPPAALAALLAPPAPAAAAAAAGPGAPAGGWALSADGKALVKSFLFPDFAAAVDAIVDLRAAAEARNHHPTLAVNRARECEAAAGCAIEVELTTYSAGGLTRADSDMALVVDALFA